MNYMNPPSPQTSESALRYLETRLRTASSVELTLILYDVLLDSLARGADAAEAGQIEERVRGTNRAVSALVELRCALDHEQGGELAQSLDRLYAYGLSQVTGALNQEAASTLRGVRRIFAPLRDAWAEVASAPQKASTAVGTSARADLLAGVVAG
jgi:flagellar protein FliS